MDTTVLEQILGMVGSAGEGAFTLALIYLLVPYFKSLVFGVVFCTIIVYGYKLIRHYNALTKETNARFLFSDEVREAAGASSAYGALSSRERQHVLKMIAAGVEATGTRTRRY